MTDLEKRIEKLEHKVDLIQASISALTYYSINRHERCSLKSFERKLKEFLDDYKQMREEILDENEET